MYTTDTGAMFYLTAATMAYPRGRVLRRTPDGMLAVYDQQQWRELAHATDIPDQARPITPGEAADRT